MSQHYWRERTSYDGFHRRAQLVRKKLGQMAQTGSSGAILMAHGIDQLSRDRDLMIYLILRGGVLTLIGIGPPLFKSLSLYRIPNSRDKLSRGSVFWQKESSKKLEIARM